MITHFAYSNTNSPANRLKTFNSRPIPQKKMSRSQSTVSEIDSLLSFIDKELEASENANANPKNNTNANIGRNRNVDTSVTTRKQRGYERKSEEKDDEVLAEFDKKRIPGTAPNPQTMNIDERVKLAASVGQECVTEDELRDLFLKKQTRPIAYDGFEPSGRMHIAQVYFISIIIITHCFHFVFLTVLSVSFVFFLFFVFLLFLSLIVQGYIC